MKYNYFHYKNDPISLSLSLFEHNIFKSFLDTQASSPNGIVYHFSNPFTSGSKININFPTLKTLIKLEKSKNFLRKIDRLIDIQTDIQTLSIHIIPNIYWYDMITYNIPIISSWKKKKKTRMKKIPTPYWKIISTKPIYIKHCKS